MHRRRNALTRFALLSIALAVAAPAAALDFRSVGDNPAILYDGPTHTASRLYVVSHGYPLEVVVTVEGWVKVRDANGAFSWVEAKQLTEKRTVMVKVPMADVRTKPEDNAPVAFQAQQNVLLDLVAVNGGWVQVRHRDGGTGYVKVRQVWGV
jgi:SH3-like domain-containing protein